MNKKAKNTEHILKQINLHNNFFNRSQDPDEKKKHDTIIRTLESELRE